MAQYKFIGNQKALFYFKTDNHAPQNRLIAININKSEQSHWLEVIPEGEDKLEFVDFVGERFVCTYLHHAAHQVRFFKIDGTPDGELDLPGLGTVIGFSGRSDDPETFYKFSNFTTPGTVFHFNVQDRSTAVFRAPDLAFNPDDYVTEQVFYESKDGTRIPCSSHTEKTSRLMAMCQLISMDMAALTSTASQLQRAKPGVDGDGRNIRPGASAGRRGIRPRVA